MVVLLSLSLPSAAADLAVSPLYAGRNNVAVVVNAPPGETVYFLSSGLGLAAPGAQTCFGALCVDILSPRIEGGVVADAAGRAVLPGSMFRGTPEQTRWFQAVHDGVSPDKTLVVVRTIWANEDGDGAWSDTDCDDTDDTMTPGVDQDGDGVDSCLDCDDTDGTLSPNIDLDADGHSSCVDCDDLQPLVHPGLFDYADALDINCDGSLDHLLPDASLPLFGPTTEEGTGHAVAGAGDFNGDGFADVVVTGDITYGPGAAGATYVMLGSPGFGVGSLTLGVSYTGEANDDLAGQSVAGVGDVDGDGMDDVLIGATGVDDIGGAYLVLGSTTPVGGGLGTTAAAHYTGDTTPPITWAGHAVAGAGDVNGDGLADLLVGAFGADDQGTDSGAAYLVLGSANPVGGALVSADAVYTGEGAQWQAGIDLDGAGDVDGDGLDDMIIGTADLSGPGAAYVVLGTPFPIGGDLSIAAARLDGEVVDDDAGYSVAGAGDVDGDGYADTLVGAPNHAPGGAAYLVLGRPAPVGGNLLLVADAKMVGVDLRAGDEVSAAGDFNADGLDDVAVGAAWEGGNTGAVYLFLGPGPLGTVLLSDADATIVGPAGQAMVGGALANAGDVDGDGFDDLLIGTIDSALDAGDDDAYLMFGTL